MSALLFKENRRIFSAAGVLKISIAAAFLFVAALIFTGCNADPASSQPQPSSASQSASSPQESSQSLQSSSQAAASEPAQLLYPTDKLFVTTERLDFSQGDLVLRVPRLGLITEIVGEIDSKEKNAFLAGEMTAEEKAAFLRNDNSNDLLSNGVMLFNLSPLPSEGNSNVTMSGHRDICGKEFYYINTIADGDMIYLDYIGKTYCYEYIETKIVAADDWSSIYCKDFSCVTLISCDPIGTHLNRIVVTGKLKEVKAIEPSSNAPKGSIGI